MPHMNRQHGITNMVNSSKNISEREACSASRHKNVSGQHPYQHLDAASEASCIKALAPVPLNRPADPAMEPALSTLMGAQQLTTLIGSDGGAGINRNVSEATFPPTVCDSVPSLQPSQPMPAATTMTHCATGGIPVAFLSNAATPIPSSSRFIQWVPVGLSPVQHQPYIFLSVSAPTTGFHHGHNAFIFPTPQLHFQHPTWET